MSSGLWAEAYSAQPYAVQGDSVRINFVLNDRLGTGVRLNGVSLSTLFDSSYAAALEKNRNLAFVKTIVIPSTQAVTQPYWLANPMAEGYFNVTDQQLIGMADVQPAFMVSYRLKIDGEDFTITKAVKYKFTDQVKGELYEPLVVLPKYTLEMPRQISITKDANDWKEELAYIAQRDLKETQVYRDQAIVVDDKEPLKKGARRQNSYQMDIEAPAGHPITTLDLHYYEIPKTVMAKQLHNIRYDHIPYITYFTDAVNRYRAVDVKTSGKKIGYIVGAGDKVPEALEQMGYEVTAADGKRISPRQPAAI